MPYGKCAASRENLEVNLHNRVGFLWLFFLNRLFKVTWRSVSEKFDCYPKIYKKRFANRFLGKKINITQKIVEFSFVQVKNILLILEILN